MKNTESKYWFTELSSDIATHTIIVEVYTRQDDEKIGEIELIYNYDKNNNYEEWTIESTEWDKELTLKECDDAMQELIDNATENFHEFAFECFHYDPRDDEFSWFI